MVATSMPGRLGARVGWSLGVYLFGALAAGEADARGLAPVPEPDAAAPSDGGEPVEGVPVQQPAQPARSDFEERMASAEERRAAKAYAEAAEQFGQAFRARPEAARGDAEAEAAVRSALVDYEIAAEQAGGDELAMRQAEAELLAEFLDARRKARAAAQIAHAVPVLEVPQDLVEALEALGARIDELVAAELAAAELAAEQEAAAQATATVQPVTGIERPRRKRPMHRLIYSNLTALRYNPLGLVNEFTGGYRYQLFKKNSLLFRESFVAAQLHTFISPAFGRIGPKIDFQPLALLNLSATYDYTGYFGTFGLNQSFKSPTDDWSDTEIGRRDDSGDPTIDNYVTTGHFVTLAALLQAKVGRIAMRDNVKFYYADYDLRAGDTVSYDQTLDIVVPNKGWTMTNDLDLLYLFDFGLTLGARYTLTQAFYQARHFQPAEPLSRPNGPTHRVGPALLYTFFDRPDKRFNKPTLIVLMQWWAAHRFRTGQDVSAAVPYLAIGFRFEGDILPDPASWHAKTEPKRKRRRAGRSR